MMLCSRIMNVCYNCCIVSNSHASPVIVNISYIFVVPCSQGSWSFPVLFFHHKVVLKGYWSPNIKATISCNIWLNSQTCSCSIFTSDFLKKVPSRSLDKHVKSWANSPSMFTSSVAKTWIAVWWNSLPQVWKVFRGILFLQDTNHRPMHVNVFVVGKENGSLLVRLGKLLNLTEHISSETRNFSILLLRYSWSSIFSNATHCFTDHVMCSMKIMHWYSSCIAAFCWYGYYLQRNNLEISLHLQYLIIRFILNPIKTTSGWKPFRGRIY